jgi:hypothetical protein
MCGVTDYSLYTLKEAERLAFSTLPDTGCGVSPFPARLEYFRSRPAC